MPENKNAARDAGGAGAGSGRSLLSHVALFTGLPAEELNGIEHSCRYRRFASGETIVDRESTTDDVFFVVRGGVRMVNFSVSGREVAFDDIGEGGHFGELPAIDEQPRSATVVALTDALIVALPAKLFRELLARHPSIGVRVMQQMARALREANERIMDLSTLAACSRVHAEVLRQARAHPVNGNAAVIAPIPVHSDIASRASTTRETVARVLNDLARKGIVKRTSGGLLINDLNRLDAMVSDVRG